MFNLPNLEAADQARRKRCGMAAVAAPKICRERGRKGGEGRRREEKGGNKEKKRRKKREEKRKGREEQEMY